jgi:hypothetical protein
VWLSVNVTQLTLQSDSYQIHIDTVYIRCGGQETSRRTLTFIMDAIVPFSLQIRVRVDAMVTGMTPLTKLNNVS